jgi:DNA polymerase-4
MTKLRMQDLLVGHDDMDAQHVTIIDRFGEVRRAVAAADSAALDRSFGRRHGHELRERARGHDDRPVVTEREPKSESRETTFPADVSDPRTLHETLGRLAAAVCDGLAEGGYAGRTVTLKIRLRPFRTHTRSRTIAAPTRDPERVRAVARELLDDFELDAPVRLLGVGVAGLVREGHEQPGTEGEPPPPQQALTLDA